MRMRHSVKKLLRGDRVDQPGVRIFPGFISVEDGRPSWWREGLMNEAGGELFGVHECRSGQPEGALLIAAKGLALVNAQLGVRWVAYSDVASWDKLSKEPVSKALVIRTFNGEAIALPFPDGGAFTFVRFLCTAIHESKHPR
jgi:hypothetical protein